MALGSNVPRFEFQSSPPTIFMTAGMHFISLSLSLTCKMGLITVVQEYRHGKQQRMLNAQQGPGIGKALHKQ